MLYPFSLALPPALHPLPPGFLTESDQPDLASRVTKFPWKESAGRKGVERAVDCRGADVTKLFTLERTGPAAANSSRKVRAGQEGLDTKWLPGSGTLRPAGNLGV